MQNMTVGENVVVVFRRGTGEEVEEIWKIRGYSSFASVINDQLGCFKKDTEALELWRVRDEGKEVATEKKDELRS